MQSSTTHRNAGLVRNDSDVNVYESMQSVQSDDLCCQGHWL
jgi:hypothetical protein